MKAVVVVPSGRDDKDQAQAQSRLMMIFQLLQMTMMMPHHPNRNLLGLSPAHVVIGETTIG